MLKKIGRLLSTQHEKDNAVVATVQFFEALGIKATMAEIEKRLQWCPTYPSIHCVQALLKQWQIDSLLLQVEPGQLAELPQALLCHTHINGGSFKTVLAHTHSEVVTLNKYGQQEIFKPEAFLKLWSGVVLLAENNEAGGMPGYKEARRNGWWRKYAAVIAATVLLAASVCIPAGSGTVSGPNLAVVSAFQLLNLAGLALCVLLLQYQFNESGGMVRKLCSIGGRQQNCDAVLKSAASKIFGLSLAEWGLGWFAGATLYTLFSPALQLSGWLSWAAAMFVPYSIYYQWRVARQWCAICLMVQAVLLLQAVCGIAFVGQWPAAVPAFAVLQYLVCIFLPAALWFTVKPAAARLPALLLSEQGYFRLKHDPAVFDMLQRQQPFYDFNNAGVLLNADGDKAEVTLVSSTTCSPCGEAHDLVEQMAMLHPEVRFRFIFAASTNPGSDTYLPVKHLLSVYKHHGANEFLSAMHQWYHEADKQYAAFNKLLPFEPSLNGVEQEMTQMEQWVKVNGVTTTPTFFLNGRKLHDSYGIEDISVMLANM